MQREPPSATEIHCAIGNGGYQYGGLSGGVSTTIATVLRERRSVGDAELRELLEFLETFAAKDALEFHLQQMRKDAIVRTLHRIRGEEFFSDGGPRWQQLASLLSATRRLLRSLFARIGMETPHPRLEYRDVQREADYAVIYHLEDILRRMEACTREACTRQEDAVQ